MQGLRGAQPMGTVAISEVTVLSFLKQMQRGGVQIARKRFYT
jgi:hypothetical protein